MPALSLRGRDPARPCRGAQAHPVPIFLPGHGGVSCCSGGGSRDREGTGGSPGSPVRDRAVSAPAGPWLRSSRPQRAPGTGTPSPGPRRGDRPAPLPVRAVGARRAPRGPGVWPGQRVDLHFAPIPQVYSSPDLCSSGLQLRDGTRLERCSVYNRKLFQNKGCGRNEKCSVCGREASLCETGSLYATA